MSDEEKKAINLLKNIDKQKCMMLECPVVKNNIKRQLKIIELNRTIRKQSKEIEELKEKNKTQSDCAEPIERTEEMVNMKWVNHNYISKDKIKAKIEEYLEYDKKHKRYMKDRRECFTMEYYYAKVLQRLLEKE